MTCARGGAIRRCCVATKEPSIQALAKAQRARDVRAAALFPRLATIKRARMLTSPHATLRGAAPLYYELLAAQPWLAEGPAGEGWIVGDLHLENVGAFRTDDDRVVFDLNDFDDAVQGPWRVDLLRLLTSVLLAGRSFQAAPPDALHLCEVLLEVYARALCAGPRTRTQAFPAPIAALLQRAKQRSRKELLDRRAPARRGGRRFERGERYLELPPRIARQVPRLFAAYLGALGDRAPNGSDTWRVLDAAQRVAGTGSLGRLRIALLIARPDDDPRLFELKEAAPSSAGLLLGRSTGHLPAAARVVAAAQALVQRPMRLLAALEVDGASFVGRQLMPQEDKLDLGELHVGQMLDEVVRTVGEVVGRAHRRAATRPPRRIWTDRELAGLLERAIVLAGIHESVALALAQIP